MKLIVPFHDLRTETAPGYEGTFGLLAPLYPEKDWDTDYRKLAQLHKKATQQRLDSVPPRARPNFTHRCVEPTTEMPEGLLMNHRVLRLPAHNPNNRAVF